MTKEQFKQKLKEHNFNLYGEFLDFVEEYQKMSYADKYSMIKEEYDADHNKPIKGYDYVCGLEDNHEEGIVSCTDRIPKDVFDKMSDDVISRQGSNS